MSFYPTTPQPKIHWDRAIILMDMNAFFASIEQADHPEWQGRAIGITNGKTGSCIITCSYEARMRGIKTGMRLKEAKKRCPDFIQVAARPERYAAVSSRIMRALEDITPDIEIFSVDEAFLDVTAVQPLLGTPAEIGQLVKRKVLEASGLCCSIGVSGDKTTAKYAAKLNKPDGLTVIPPWQARETLKNVPVTELCGIAGGIGAFLAQRGVHVCGDMEHMPVSVLAQRFGNLGRRIWLMCQGLDPDGLHQDVPQPKSIGHGKVMPPNTRDVQILETYLMHMAEKVAARLRRHQLQAQTFFIGLRSKDSWLADKMRCETPTDDARHIMKLARQLLHEQWRGEGVFQVQITALDPKQTGNQVDMFSHYSLQTEKLLRVRDAINQRYGEFTLAPAPLLRRSSMPNVIAPAWKPYGHRETILGY
jgi:DNA polymerase IV